MTGDPIAQCQKLFAGRLLVMGPPITTADVVFADALWDGCPVEVCWIALQIGDDHARRVGRRRHAPSPPCLPVIACESTEAATVIVAASRPGSSIGALPKTTAIDEALDLLERVAMAIDKLHRFRLSHGSLSDATLVCGGRDIWIREVGIGWGKRARDLTYFDGLCRRTNAAIMGADPSDDDASPIARDQPTAKAILDDWRPRFGKAAADNSPAHALSDADDARQIARSVKSDPQNRLARTRRSVAAKRAVLAITICAATVLAIGPVQLWRDFLACMGMRTRDDRAPAVASRDKPQSEVERLFDAAMTTAASWTAQRGPRAGEAARDAAARKWRELAQLRTTATQVARYAFADFAERQWDRWFLKLAGRENLAGVRRRLEAKDAATRLDACQTLARLGEPVAPAQLEAMMQQSEDEDFRTGVLLLVLRQYSYASSNEFLRRHLIAPSGRPRPRLFGLAAQAPSPTCLALLDDGFAALVSGDEFEGSPNLIACLVCIQHIRRLAPERLLIELPISPADRDRVRDAVTRQLLTQTGIRLKIDGREIPDVWFAAAVHWSRGGQVEFLDAVLGLIKSRASPLTEPRGRSLLLTLANVESAELRERLSDALIDRIAEHRHWFTSKPGHAAALLTVLAAMGAKEGSRYLDDFFLRQEASSSLFWHAMLDGAAASPDCVPRTLGAAVTNADPGVSHRARAIIALRLARTEVAIADLVPSSQNATIADTAHDGVTEWETGWNAPPLVERCTLARQLIERQSGSLHQFHRVLRADSSVLVQHTAAMGLRLLANPEHESLLNDAARSPALFAVVRAVLASPPAAPQSASSGK